MQAVRPVDPWLDAVAVMLIPGKGLWNVLLSHKARSPVLYSLLTNLLNWVAPKPCPHGAHLRQRQRYSWGVCVAEVRPCETGWWHPRF